MTNAAIMGAGARVALSGRESSMTPSMAGISTRSPSAGSLGSSTEVPEVRLGGSTPSRQGGTPVMALGPREPDHGHSPLEAAMRVLWPAAAGHPESGGAAAPTAQGLLYSQSPSPRPPSSRERPTSGSESHRRSPSVPLLPSTRLRSPGLPAAPAGGGAGSARPPTTPPDVLDQFIAREELRRATAALARATAAPEIVNALDLPGLAALRAELVRAHAAALERIDDRRVILHSEQVSTHEGPERGRCVACWSRNADRLLLPCRHLCLCGTCWRSCKSTCPICRGAVSNVIEVFGCA